MDQGISTILNLENLKTTNYIMGSVLSHNQKYQEKHLGQTSILTGIYHEHSEHSKEIDGYCDQSGER